MELFLNSTAGGSNGAYGSQMMGGIGKKYWCENKNPMLTIKNKLDEYESNQIIGLWLL